MKEKLFNLLSSVIDECANSDCKHCKFLDNEYCSTRRQVDFLVENGVTITGKEYLKCTSSRNYEAEYHELQHKYNLLYKDHKAMETEFVRMRAQLDIVNLIFGGK